MSDPFSKHRLEVGPYFGQKFALTLRDWPCVAPLWEWRGPKITDPGVDVSTVVATRS